MKYKTTEEKSENNPFLEDVLGLCTTCLQFIYAIKSYADFLNGYRADKYKAGLKDDLKQLTKLAISLNREHKYPDLSPELKGVESVDELKTLEEKYYNKLKAIGNNALEANDIEVVGYISNIITHFEHYFCTLNESNDSGETSS